MDAQLGPPVDPVTQTNTTAGGEHPHHATGAHTTSSTTRAARPAHARRARVSVRRLVTRRIPAALTTAVLALTLVGGILLAAQGTIDPASAVSSGGASNPLDVSGNNGVPGGGALGQDNGGGGGTGGQLAPAAAPPAPAPPSLADAPPLKSHEVFAFAPYWTLDQSASFNVNGISTLAYFDVDVNANGTLVESGAGWNGYESQDLADLVTRAHAAGDRVVLTVDDFDQQSLDALTSSPTAPATLANALVSAVSAKNLDGVNLDLEGQGSADQTGLTNLVTAVANTLHAANPHYQVTMDTYASSASDPGGFYDIPALNKAVDGFFVMEYNPNVSATAQATSPLTSGMFSDLTTAEDYAAAVPASKVILGLPFFGIDWPTTNGTLTAQATGPATDVSLGDILSSGHPIYWDSTTDSGWTSYQVGAQWHETFFDVPTSFYDAALLAQQNGLAGVGIWALGMDGNDPSDLAALLGSAPAVKGGPAGPAVTSSSPTLSSPPPGSSTTGSTSPPSSPSAATSPAPTTSSTTTTTPPTNNSSSGAAPSSTASTPTPSTPSPSSTPATTPSSPTTSTTTSTSTSTTTSTTTTTTTAPTEPPYTYTAVWNQHPVTLTEVSGSAVPATTGTAPAGQLQQFSTKDPATSCLAQGSALQVWAVQGNPNELLVVATTPGDCTTADFIFTVPGTAPG